MNTLGKKYQNETTSNNKMNDSWKKLQKEVINKDKRLNAPFQKVEKKLNTLTKVIKDPDSYNANIASKDRVEALEEAIEDLSINSHEPIEFMKKLQELHDKIDSIYSLLEVLSDRLNKLKYFESANPHGDDDYATP